MHTIDHAMPDNNRQHCMLRMVTYLNIIAGRAHVPQRTNTYSAGKKRDGSDPKDCTHEAVAASSLAYRNKQHNFTPLDMHIIGHATPENTSQLTILRRVNFINVVTRQWQVLLL